MKWIHERMANDVRSGLRFSMEVLHACFNEINNIHATATDFTSKEMWDNLGFFMSVGYISGLRDEEIIKIDPYNLKVYMYYALEHHTPFITIYLLSKLKGETCTRSHIIHMTTETGINNAL